MVKLASSQSSVRWVTSRTVEKFVNKRCRVEKCWHGVKEVNWRSYSDLIFPIPWAALDNRLEDLRGDFRRYKFVVSSRIFVEWRTYFKLSYIISGVALHVLAFPYVTSGGIILSVCHIFRSGTPCISLSNIIIGVTSSVIILDRILDTKEFSSEGHCKLWKGALT